MQKLDPVLSGLRVLELGHFIAAPFATRLLGDLGADVIKIEPATGDPARAWGEMIDGRSLLWSMHARNKRSVAINLKSVEGRELVRRLAATCDVVVENFRPGHLATLGLGPEQLRADNPDLIVAHVSGYGQTGPCRDRPSFGAIGEAIGGLRYLTNHPPGTTDLPPVRVGISIGDSLAGLYAAFGIMSALWQRDRYGGDGKARTLDVALSEAMLSLMEGMLPEYGALGKIKQPSGGGIPTAAPSNAYRAADGKWILIAANSEPLFARLCQLLGRPELTVAEKFKDNPARVSNAAELDAIIGKWTATLPSEQALSQLIDAGIPSSKVFDAADCATDPQYLARGMIREVDDPALGRVLQAGVVPTIPESPGEIRWTGPDVGQHTNEVLSSLLGLTADRLDELRTSGAIA